MTNNYGDIGSNGTTPAKRSTTKRTALLIGGGVLAAAVLVGGGVALGASLSDDDDDRRVSDTADLGDQVTGQDDASTDGGTTPSGAPTTLTHVGTADADEINDVIATAADVAASDGLGGVATDVDATNVGGWDVQFEATNGDETTVSVDADGTARVSDTDVADDDQGPTGELDVQTVEAIVAAALAESDGVITDISIDDDGRSPYDVTVLRADRTTVEIDLGADFSVLSSDVDTED
ncbi:hypothetical protein [Labedella gwakjiensis]|nr:hypothetical protein [Labedella gwakjiensis]RUQ87373.1 hypothetical protein ELQ93_10795 [Labedella gwakjiensis]